MTRASLWTPGTEPAEGAPTTALYLPGTSGNNITTPDAAAISILGDFDARLYVNLDAYSLARSLCGVYAAGNIGWYIFRSGATACQFVFSSNGSDDNRVTVSGITYPTGWTWLRFTLDIDNGAGSAVGTVYSSSNGSTWVQLGTGSQAGLPTAIYDSTAPLSVGSFATAAGHPGAYQQFELRSVIDGTIVASWDGSWPHTRQRDPQGNIWTVNGTANAWQVVE